MDIRPSYSCLLGRPWIHKAGAITSTLHQKLKYHVKGKIVIVQGEEEYMVSHLNSFRYVEMDGEFIKTPFQHFEEVPQTLASVEIVVEDSPMKMASLKDVPAIIEMGECANWGQLPDFTQKTNKFGLGFTADAQRAVQSERIGRPLVFISNSGVNAIEDDVEDSEFDSWISPTTYGGQCHWIAKDCIPISLATQ